MEEAALGLNHLDSEVTIPQLEMRHEMATDRYKTEKSNRYLLGCKYQRPGCPVD